MCKLTIIDNNKHYTINAKAGTLISDLLKQVIPQFALPCMGNHICGKCFIHVNGSVQPPEPDEYRLLGEEVLQKGIRLACSCRLTGDAVINISRNHSGKSSIIAWYKIPKQKITETGFGIAADIGTTTVAMQLFDRSTGNILSECLQENIQRSFGADVISRISACKTSGVDVLSSRINKQLEDMASKCMKEARIEKIDEAVVTGNTTMLHLYEGLNPETIAVFPFSVKSLFGNISKHTLAGAPVYLPRCISAYIGADIVCSILASNILNGDTRKNDVQLLADIGTNGEIVLVNKNKIICCSTAAGPAFEGVGLSHGMPAAPGAINKVWREKDNIFYKTVAGKTAIGICGSGILDALAVMLQAEIMDDSGFLNEDFTIGDSDVQIIQKDIRQIQLAKSAICAGIITLTKEAGIDIDMIKKFLLAGGFGSSINLKSACSIGLFPKGLMNKTDFIGNSALGGAVMLLMNKDLRTKSEEFAKKAEEISLSANRTFMDYYIDCMSFDEF